MTLDVTLNHRFDRFTLDLDFSVSLEGVTALFGPSGAGKTRAIMAIAGLLRPQEGKITIAGRTVLDTSKGLFVPPHKRRVGYVFQDARLFPHMNVAANLNYGAKRSPQQASKGEKDALIDMLGIGDLMDRRPAGLSGGEKQRVALGRTLLAKPDFLLLDEPLAALDQGRKGDILPYLERLRDEAQVPMIYVSHSIDEVTRLADSILLLNKGQIAAQGSVEEVMARLDLFPLTGRFEAGAVLQTKVRSHDHEHHITNLGFSGGAMQVPMVALEPGTNVRVRVRARDVMLALEPPNMISANNVIPAEVLDIREETGAYLDVLLACGSERLLARITRLSRARLGGLPQGQKVYAVIKSVSVERRSSSAAQR